MSVAVDPKRMRKQRQDRLSQAKGRQSRRSYVTEIENLQILIAWAVGELSEGQAARALKMDRVLARVASLSAVQAGVALSEVHKRPVRARKEQEK